MESRLIFLLMFVISALSCSAMAAQNATSPDPLENSDLVIDELASTADFGVIYIADRAGDDTVLNDRPSTAVKKIVKLQDAAIPLLIRHLAPSKIAVSD